MACALLLAVLTSLLIAPPANATTLSWPSGDIFSVGQAKWQFNEYGLANGWDINDNWSSDGYIFYPNEFTFDGESQYFLCGDSTTYATDSVLSQTSSGAIDILCPETPVPGYPNLVAQLHFLIYPEADSGYLVRQDIAITNSSSNYEVIPDLVLINYPNLHADYRQGQYAGHEEAEWFVDSVNSPFTGWLWENASYFSQGMGDGRAVALSNAWALTGEANNSHYRTDPSNSDGNPYGGSGTQLKTSAPNYFAANTTTHLLTFTNMVLPTDVSTGAGAIAKQTALDQTSEFDSFDGRLVEGLPECTAYAGWGTTAGDCNLGSSSSGGTPAPSTSPQPCIAALAETGFNFFISLLGGLGAAAVGMWFIYQSKKPLRPERGRIRRLLFPES